MSSPQTKSKKGIKWYQLTVAEALTRLHASKRGLDQSEIGKRRQRYGPNKLPAKEHLTGLQIFIDQFKSAFIYMLLIAVVISILLGEHIDAGVIALAVVINVIVGYLQEYKAQEALAALEKVVTTQARVRRKGQIKIIPAADLVPGDIVELRAGDKVPADLRILAQTDLALSEAALTGESEPVSKVIKPFKGKLVIGDRANLAFMGTSVARGAGQGVVFATGLRTAIGQIAALVKTTEDEETPLQRKLNKFSTKLAILIVLLSAVIFATGLILGLAVAEMFTTVVAIAVAAIPEGLVVALTVILAIGMREILKEQGLVKKLLAAETLGSTSVICSDKTGTLTRGEMRVSQIVGDQEIKFADQVEAGHIEAISAAFGLALRIGVLCNNAFFMSSSPLGKGESSPADASGRTERSKAEKLPPLAPPYKGGGEFKVNGTPTEKALLLAGWQAGLNRKDLEKKSPRLSEIPFSSAYKYMMTLHRYADDENIIYLKGAPEIVLEKLSSHQHTDGAEYSFKKPKKLTAIDRRRLKKRYEKMSAKGLRVLAVAYKRVPSTVKSFPPFTRGGVRPLAPAGERGSKDKAVADRSPQAPPWQGGDGFVFVGFMGLRDPLRPDTRETIEKTSRAGVKTVMITGDHELTARSIAGDLGLPHDASNVLTGTELVEMTASELKRRVPKTSVFARVSPEDKLKIVRAWQSRGEVVAMTGDGVNDAPALKRADIGVAVGSGTDVAKEVADLILLDDDFKTIVTAVEKGRVIYDNIRKVILYFLANAFVEMGVIMGGLFLGWPLPILASQILWVNLVNDILPSLALAQDPEEREVMKELPQKRGASVLDRERLALIGVISLLSWLVILWVFWYFWQGQVSQVVHARSVAFVLLGSVTLIYIFSLRSLRRPIWRSSIFSNRFLVIAVLIGFALQAAAVYIPFLQKILRSAPLSLTDWAMVIVISFVLVIAIEIVKWFFSFKQRRAIATIR